MNKSTIQGNIIACTLGLVFIWFGVNEILYPSNWTSFIPPFSFLSSINLFENNLIVVHGTILLILAVLMIFNIWRSFAGVIALILLFEIIITLFIETDWSINTNIAENIGLFGLALAIAFSKGRKEEGKMTKYSAPGIFPNKYT